MTDEDEVFAAAQREGKRRADERRTAEKLWASAGPVMAEVRCRDRGHLVAVVHDSPEGPLLLLEHPADEAADLVGMNKKLRDLDSSKVGWESAEIMRRYGETRAVDRALIAYDTVNPMGNL